MPRARALQQEKPPPWKPAHCNEEQPPLAATRESPCAATKNQRRDFPGGAVVKNPPASAGSTGSSPGSSHMPRSNWAHAPQLLSLRSRAREPQLLSPCATTTEARAPRARAPQQEKPPQWEARAPQQRVASARHN